MEQWERAHIKKNSFKLLTAINCTDLFLNHLDTVGEVLGVCDLEKIQAAVKEGQTKAASELLKILETRVGGYQALVGALIETRQTGALAILNEMSGSVMDSGEASANTPVGSTTTEPKTIEYIVGDDNCSFDAVCAAIVKSPAPGSILTDWSRVATKLGLSTEVRDKIKRDYREDTLDFVGAIERILEKWRKGAQKTNGKATLSKLRETLTDCDLCDAADKLRDEFP